MNKKNAIGIAAVTAIVIVGGLEWNAFRSVSKTDQENLNKQLAANGMGSASGGMQGPQAMQARMLDGMAKEVGLDDKQKEQIGAIQAGMFPRMEQIFKDKSLSREQKMQQMQTAREENESQIRGLLSAEQQTRYDAMQKRMRDRMAAMGGPGGAMPPNGMTPPGGMPPNGMPPNGMMPPDGDAPGRTR